MQTYCESGLFPLQHYLFLCTDAHPLIKKIASLFSKVYMYNVIFLI